MKRLAAVALALFVAVCLFAEQLDKKQWSRLRRNLDKAVRMGDAEAFRGVVAEMAQDDSERAVGMLLKAVRAVQDEETFNALRDALASMRSDEATAALLKEALSGRDANMRVMAVEAIAARKDVNLLLKLESVLTARKENPLVVRTVLEAMGEAGDLRIAEMLINYLERIEKERKGAFIKGTDWLEAVTALKRIAGGKVEYHTAADWRKWLEVAKEGAKNRTPGNTSNPRTSVVVVPAPRLFKKEVVSRTPIFVIDTSGSMNEQDKITAQEADEMRRGPMPRRTTVVRSDDKDGKKKPPSPPAGKEMLVARIERAKFQLVKLIYAMDSGVSFNIVAYDNNIRCFDKRMVKATPANKKKAIKWVKGLTAQYMTHTDEALEKAWEFVKDGCDTIYLLSDGWPTHTGDPKKDGDLLEEKILKFFRRKNFMKKIKVHTLGFKGAHKSFMKQLAKENGGTYEDIRGLPK